MATTPPFKYQPMFEKGKDTTVQVSAHVRKGQGYD